MNSGVKLHGHYSLSASKKLLWVI